MLVHTPDYYELLEGYDLHQTKKDDLIHILVRWAESFIDRAFGVDPVQHAQSFNTLAASQDS